MVDYSLLDNPVWNALAGPHRNFSIELGYLLGYRTDYAPFAAARTSADLSSCMDEYYLYAGEFFVVGEKPSYTGELHLKRELVCLQMVCEQKMSVENSEEIISLTPYRDEVFALVNRVQPGFFRANTIDMGAYHGIFNNGMLVAITGERMRLNGLSEVSAVVTHPEYTGKGYAKQLVNFATNKILSEGNIPFLHVAVSNQRAIRLYEMAGYRARREMSFWNYAAGVES